MHRWISYTMVRVVVFFIPGILAAVYCADWISDITAAAFFIFFLSTYFYFNFLPAKSKSRSVATGISGIGCIFFAGFWALLAHTESRSPSYFAKSQEAITYYSGILAVPQKKSNSTQVVIGIENIFCRGKWYPASGRVLLYIADLSAQSHLQYSSRVLVRGSPQPVPPPMNPGEFDFRNYLRQKNVTYQHRIRASELTILDEHCDSGVQFYAQQASLWAAARIKKWLPDPRQHGITSALVLGVSTDLDAELRNAYSASGAMHVLSVSGLHVGAIYAVVVLLLKPLAARAWSRWPVAALSLIFLWSYAFITGLSPSVLRAVVMFSFMVVGGPFGRRSNIYNTLAASAFLLLLMDPWLILNVGFQLSYLAVAGIAWFQKPIYGLWQPTSFALDKIWQITSVSLAAQGATSIVGLFYFHQFPVYFLISNLIVVPVSTGVLMAGIALVIVAGWPIIATGVSWVTSFLVSVLNGTVIFIEELPASVIDGVTISVEQCVVAMFMLSFIYILCQTRKFYFIWMCVLLSMVFGVMQWKHFFKDVIKNRLIVYYMPGKSAFEKIGNGRSALYADSALLANATAIKFHIEPYRIMSGVAYSEGVTLSKSPIRFDGFDLFQWNRKTIMYLYKRNAHLPTFLTVDYVIAANNSITSLAGIRRKISFKELVLDSSNVKMNTEKILKEASTLHIDVYSVREKGTRIIQL